MRAEVDFPSSLRSTVYCQSLPVPLVRQRPSSVGFRGNKKLARRSREAPKVWAFQVNDGRLLRDQQWVPTRTPQTHIPYNSLSYNGLDENTLHWKSWISYKDDCKTNNHDLSMYRITQDVFRKLSIQVKEVKERLTNSTGSGFKTYHSIGDKYVSVIKPSQLASNIPSPSVSISSDYNPDKMSAVLTTQSIGTSNKRRPHSTTVLSRQRIKLGKRPHSTTGTRLCYHQYSDSDRLTPDIIGALSEGEMTDRAKEFPGPFDIVARDSKPCESESERFIEYDPDLEKREILEVKKLEEEDLSKKEMVEKMFEYEDEDEVLERHKSLAAMIPEEVDEDEVIFDYRGFSAPYKPQADYAEALSEPFCHMDLLELSLLDKDWRTVMRKMPENDELAIIERLIELERAQFNTERWERKERIPPKRAPSALQETKGWNGEAALPTERAQSALARHKTNKNCSESCTEILCVGDCPSKKQKNIKSCLHCRQVYCDGSCTEYGYHLYVRQPKEDDDVVHLPKSCRRGCCSSSKMNTINSNQMIMGRPKSAFATFTSTKHSSAKAKPMQLSDTPGAERVRSAMMSLGLKEPSRPSTGKKITRARGRNAMIPGKSYQSQRRYSLTEEPLSTSAAKMNPKGLHYKKKSRPKAVKR
ncbi:uncharacterized protein LOC117114920 [Anneissia japonica]|uniref:uncharacterized protein LOC117114920 n=1 Tax=Anneissia japonica TaxID=1529436 RepID=UPI0014258C78|nr:uncharacterized protein LOC117114920 [Anneissia japonica]